MTDFSWTDPLDFLDIMLGLPERSQLCSVIFEVRTVIFGQNDLCPYAGRGFYFLWILKTLITEPPDGQSHCHPAQNEPNFNVGQSPLEGSVRVLVDWNMVSNASI